MYAAILIQQDVFGFRHQVTSMPVGQTALKASSRLIEQSPSMLLADSRIKSLQDLLQAYAVISAQRELRTTGSPGVIFAHHRAQPAKQRPSIIIEITAQTLKYTLHFEFIQISIQNFA